MTLQKMLIVTTAAVLLTAAAQAQVAMTDIGATAPTPGANDISQFNTGGGNPPGLNYYWDNGANNPTSSGYISQSFTTLGNAQGYTLTSLAIKTAGAGGGNPPSIPIIYGFVSTCFRAPALPTRPWSTAILRSASCRLKGDWIQWTGLRVSLMPNTNYAYGFGRSPGSPGDWEELDTSSSNPYSGGAVCEIIDAGGKVKYSSSSSYDATFDLGLSLPAAPIASPPLESPSYANLGVLAGTTVTLTASAAGSTPISYQWQTDGGSGGTLTNVPGAYQRQICQSAPPVGPTVFISMILWPRIPSEAAPVPWF